MSVKNRAANRMARKTGRAKDHGPLLSCLEEDRARRVPVKAKRTAPTPLNAAQRAYDNAINVNDVVFGLGPAGTGKTWYAAMKAAAALDSGDIERIVVTRPAVEAGESLGFLPGEEDEKYAPYFRPVREALEEFFGSGSLEYMLKSGVVEARPLAYLRGATIKNAWLIADEMQNASIVQTKMLLTRIGSGSKFIINGDPRQCDLPARSASGLLDASRRLARVKSIETVIFTAADIVRHGIIQEIVEAYETSSSIPSSDRYIKSDDSDDPEAGLKTFLGAT